MSVLETVYGNEPVPFADLLAAQRLLRQSRADVTTLQVGDRIAMLDFTGGDYVEQEVIEVWSSSLRDDGLSWHIRTDINPGGFVCSPTFAGCHRVASPNLTLPTDNEKAGPQ